MPTTKMRIAACKCCKLSLKKVLRMTVFIAIVILFIYWTQKPKHVGNKDHRNSSEKRYVKGPVRHVAFLKTHKTGSTSAQSIFLRYGWTRNLTFVLPFSNNRYGFPNIISLTRSLSKQVIIPPPLNKTHEILCAHVVYNRTAFREIMPNDTVYVGIIRDPFHQFISTINYFKPKYFEDIKGDDKLVIYLTNPKKYEPRNPILSFTNNRMSIELGFPPEVVYSKNPEKVKKYLKELDEEFPVMLILEKFDQSLLLMQKHFKWQTKDILYIKKNIGALTRTYSADSATEEQMNLFKQWASVDYQLYKYFHDRLEQQTKAFGDDFVEQLDNFMDILRKMEDFCIHKTQESLKPGLSRHIMFPANKWYGAFNVTGDDCYLLLLDEIEFIQRIRKRQYGTERL